MSNIKTKEEKNNMPVSFKENINKYFGLIFIFSMCVVVAIFINFRTEVNNLNLQIEKYNRDVGLNTKEVFGKIDDLSKEITRYNQVKIDKDQFTEIYMQLQELTGMISNELKREFYITKMVKVISGYNTELDSETIYEIAKTVYEEALKYNFNPLLITALIKVESNFDVKAISDSYAYGLCQVRRFIAPELSENIGIEWDGAEKTLFDPIKNIKIGVYYLSMLNRDFNNLRTAVISYNQGPYYVQEIISSNLELSQIYANKVFDYYNELRGFTSEEIENEIMFTN